MYYVYLLQCGDGSLYTGITNDPPRRLREHRKAGGRGAKYTRAHPPVSFRDLWLVPDKSSALRLEARLRRLPHGEKLALSRERVRSLPGGEAAERVSFDGEGNVFAPDPSRT